MLKGTAKGDWIEASPRVDLSRLDATTDADIAHQRLAELVDDVLRRNMGSVTVLANALQLSTSTIRRWRRGAATPTAANLLKLQKQLSASD